MQMIKKLPLICILCLASQFSNASGNCKDLFDYLVIKHSSSYGYLDNWCNLHEAVASFRNRFISRFGKEKWEKLSWYKDNPNEYGGLRIDNFDLDIDDIIQIAKLLNANKITENINHIEINKNTYGFKKLNDKWYFDFNIEAHLQDNYSDIKKYLAGLDLASSAMEENKTPEEIMNIFHKNITLVIAEKYLK